MEGAIEESGLGLREDAAKYLVVRLERHNFGLDITRVQEMVPYSSVTKVPFSRPDIKGVMNLRGKIIPVVDLAELVGVGRLEASRLSCFVVCSFAGDGNTLSLAFAVDEVSEVAECSASDLHAHPGERVGQRTSYELGFINTNEGLVTVIALDELCKSLLPSHS